MEFCKSKFLKHAGYEIAPIISELINKSIEQGCFPSVLKKASVVQICKKTDKLEKGNYRPISILPILAKIFEKVLAHQISPFLNDVLSPHLSAFRRGYSCQDALLCLLEHWRKDLLAKKKIGALLIDLSKAFNCMPHELLVSKLEAYGVQPKSSKFILSYLFNRQQRVRVGEKCSSWKTTSKGVPQGSVLGPMLLNVFGDDLFHFVKNVLLTNYADDNTLSYAKINLQITPGRGSRQMHLVVCYKLHESQSGQISGYFIKLRERGQSLSLRKWLLHCAKRRCNTAGSETGQSASF